jgi:hypothetical protein
MLPWDHELAHLSKRNQPWPDIDTIDGRIAQLVSRWVLPEHRDVAKAEIRELIDLSQRTQREQE